MGVNLWRCLHQTSELQKLNLEWIWLSDTNKPSLSDTDKPFTVGEHITVFWLDSVYEWHLGIVENVNQNGELDITYLKRSDQSGKYWISPEDPVIYTTLIEQVLCRNIKVSYQCSVRIKCGLSDEGLISYMDRAIESLNVNQ